MIPRIRNRRGCGRMALVHLYRGAFDMKWETPQAVDFRFGMEITMYIAKR